MASERQTVAERLTVGFIPKAARELAELVTTTGLTKADIINRAISLYAFVTTELRAGRTLLVRDEETGHVERVHLL